MKQIFHFQTQAAEDFNNKSFKKPSQFKILKAFFIDIPWRIKHNLF